MMTPAGYAITPIEGKTGRRYTVRNIESVMEVPSVTTILDIQNKPGLPWWGMKVGVAGMLEMWENDIIGHYDVTVDECVAKLTENKLTVNHVLGSAGDRGTRVHDGFEGWCHTGLLPDFAFGTPEEGYMTGLRAALEYLSPFAEVLYTEVHVASMEWGFAGRTDAIIRISGAQPISSIEDGTFIFDLKTSSGVYTSHFRQLAAYEYAAKESGYGEMNGGYVLWVGKDGAWRIKRSPAEFERDFLPARHLWESEQVLKGQVK